MISSLKKEINYYRKDWVHRSYSRIIKDFKDYDNISRNKILDEVTEFYKDYNNVLSMCTYNELKLLEYVLNSKNKIKEIDDKHNFEKNELHDKFLMHYSLDEKSYYIPSEMVDSIKLALKNIDKKYYKYKDETNDLLIGIFKVYGILTLDELKEIISNYIKVDDKLLNIINNDKLFSFYTYNYDKYIIYEPYYEYEEELLYFYEINKDIDFNIRKKDELIYLRYHQFNDKNPKIKKFINEIEKLHFFQFSLYNRIEEYVVTNAERNNLIESFINIPALKNIDLTKHVKLMKDAMDEMVSPCFKGASYNEFLNVKVKESDNRYKNTYNKVKDKDSIKKYKEAREKVNNIFDTLLMYTYCNNYENRFNNYVSKNNLYLTRSNYVTNLILFHSLNGEKTILEEYCDKELKIYNPFYKCFIEFKDSYVESLFKVKDLNPNEAQVTLEDSYTKKLYTIYDVALSSSSKEAIGSYIYTSLVTIDGYTFTTEYSFIITSKKIINVLHELNKEAKAVKSATNIYSKRFAAAYKLSKKEDVKLRMRVLE